MKSRFFSKRKTPTCRKQYLCRGLVAVSVFLVFTAEARAQKMLPDTPPHFDARMEERRETFENAQDEQVKAQEEQRKALSEKFQVRVVNLAQNAVGRLEAASDRLEDIARRLYARIEKLNAQGIDTAEATASHVSAMNTLGLVKEKITILKSTINQSLTSGTPRESFKIFRAQFNDTVDLVRVTHQELRETVKLLKQAIAEAELGRGTSDTVRNKNSAIDAPKEIER